MKKIIISLLVVVLLIFSAIAAEDVDSKKLDSKDGVQVDKSGDQDDSYDDFEETVQEDIYHDIGDVTLTGDPGLTPDSTFYFIENIVESVLVGDDPEKALAYKEEKILELKAMLESDNIEGAEEALERADKYNKIIQKEVSPKIEKRVRESSKAVKDVLKSFEDKLEDKDWKDVKKEVDNNIKQEDKIALAAKISKKINDLCETLSDLDPLEYSKVCKTGDDAPKWKRDLDRKLTAEQEKEAKEFMEIMSECFQNPSECRCDDISIKPFAKQCNIIAPLVAKCDSGDEDACEKMEEVEDPIDLLPDYLQDIMDDLEDNYGDAKHDLHIPMECVKEGATTREACMKVMFKIHAPPECLAALESGKIDPKNENEARKACEAIMFEQEAPEECIEAGLKDFRECERYMFKLDAPEECLDAGLDGSGRSDWKKCELIRFKLDAPKECLDAGITGENRNDWKKCEAIRFKMDSPKECLDAGLTGEGRDDWKKCDAIRFRLDAPKDCLDAGITGDNRNDWKKCEAIKFKSEAHPDCLAAGLTGEGRDDWRKCQKIQFKAEAPEECIAAGLTGEGRRDWDECNKISQEAGDHGKAEDCSDDQWLKCDNSGYCKCVDKDDEGHQTPGTSVPGTVPSYSEVCCSEPGADDAPVYRWRSRDSCSSPPGAGFPVKIVDDSQCGKVDSGTKGPSCGDCSIKCPGASRTDCVNNECKCYFEHEESECKDGCQQECGDQKTDCREGMCVCLGYDYVPPPGDSHPSDIPDTTQPDDGTSHDSGTQPDSSTPATSPDSGSSTPDSGSDTSQTQPDSTAPATPPADSSSDSGSDSGSTAPVDSGSSDTESSDPDKLKAGDSDSGSDSGDNSDTSTS